MDMRLLMVLAAVALLQSLFARKRARGGEEAGEADAAPGAGGVAEGIAAPEGKGAAGRLDAGCGVPKLGEAPAARQVWDAPAAQDDARSLGGPAPRGPSGRKKGFVEALLEEIAAQAKTDLPAPEPGGRPAAGPRPLAGRPRSAGRAAHASAGAGAQLERASSPTGDALPSFGLPEPRSAGAAAGEPGGRPARSPATPDPWALEPVAPESVADPPPRPERSPSKRPEDGVPGAPRSSLQPDPAGAGDGRYGLGTRDGLRRIVVAREVLGPPLALRRLDRAEDVRA